MPERSPPRSQPRSLLERCTPSPSISAGSNYLITLLLSWIPQVTQTVGRLFLLWERRNYVAVNTSCKCMLQECNSPLHDVALGQKEGYLVPVEGLGESPSCINARGSSQSCHRRVSRRIPPALELGICCQCSLHALQKDLPCSPSRLPLALQPCGVNVALLSSVWDSRIWKFTVCRTLLCELVRADPQKGNMAFIMSG